MSVEHPVPTDPPPPADTGRDRQARAVVQQLRIVYRAMQEHSRWVERQCGVSAAHGWAALIGPMEGADRGAALRPMAGGL